MELYRQHLEMIDPLLGKRNFMVHENEAPAWTQLEPVILIRHWKHLNNFKCLWKKIVRTGGLYNVRFQWVKLHRRKTSVKILWGQFRFICILKDRISCSKNELSKKDTIIDFLSKQLTASKYDISHGNDRGSCSVNVKESAKDNWINDTANETLNRNEQSIKKLALYTAWKVYSYRIRENTD